MTAQETARRKALPEAAEVVVIGGGIAGCATAYFLAKAGVPVALLEKGRIAGEQSSRNWGWVRKQGRDPRELPAIIESMKIWEGLEAALGADLGWHRGGVTYLARSDRDLAGFEAWLDHAKAYQLDSRMLSAAETDAVIGQDQRRWKGALFTASDGRAEPAKAAPALAAAAARHGATVLTETAVRTVETEAGRVSGVVTEHGPIACRGVVCAAGAWTGLFCANLGIGLPQLGVKASVLRTAPAPLVTQAGVWCEEVAYRRRQDGGYSVARSGATVFELVPEALRHFKVFWPAFKATRKDLHLRFSTAFLRSLFRRRRWGPDEVTDFERTRVLDPTPEQGILDGALTALRQAYPELRDVTAAESWAGMIETTPDAIPVLGEAETLPGFFIATGFSGHGFGMGPAAGLLMSELVREGRARVDLAPFRLSRFTDGSKIEIYGAP